MLETAALRTGDLADLERLFTGSRVTAGCWCMWHIIAVKEYHRGGGPANEAGFRALAAASGSPMGVLARLDGEPVGWAAAGPRSRYARAVRTPTMKGLDPDENDSVWLVPCFFVREDRRRLGIARHLLTAATELARAEGARAIEGFPATGATLGGDRQVGTEHLFRGCGFEAVRRPSSARVVMRRDFLAG